jgi:hypothetical protein
LELSLLGKLEHHHCRKGLRNTAHAEALIRPHVRADGRGE